MYIYNLPYLELKECCKVLDDNNLWEELGVAHMNYPRCTVEKIKKDCSSTCGKSPSETLLLMWGNQNHTVIELFILLHRIENYSAMKILRKFVDPYYHILIEDSGIKKETKKKNDSIENVKPVNRISSEDINIVLAGRVKDVLKETSTCVLESAGFIPQIPYEDLRESTNNWDPSTILGKGGFGTVYKGNWKCTDVAIKRNENKRNDSNQQMKLSITELHCLNSYRHDNILPIYGFSIDGPEPCLIYQYMAGGSLDLRLRVTNPDKMLKWSTRLNISVGTARGLQFLHTYGDKPLVHTDIKSANILLDLNDTPRIGDFGLAREGPGENYSYIKVSRIAGTRPYLPDEFLRGKQFSPKIDTYSFGIVLFEISTGQIAYSVKRRWKFLKDHVVEHEGDLIELKDPRIEGGENCFTKLIEIGKKCVLKRAKDRPEMIQVLKELEGIS